MESSSSLSAMLALMAGQAEKDKEAGNLAFAGGDMAGAAEAYSNALLLTNPEDACARAVLLANRAAARTKQADFAGTSFMRRAWCCS
jgi:predicted TPR repeat methyltransferase